MDGYYQNQLAMPYFSGAPRQRGSGLGSLALSVARTAMPIFRKFVVPTLKSIGKDLVTEAVPEMGYALAGDKSLKEATRSTIKRTVKKQVGGARKRKRSRKSKPRKTSKTRKTKKRKVDLLAKLK